MDQAMERGLTNFDAEVTQLFKGLREELTKGGKVEEARTELAEKMEAKLKALEGKKDATAFDKALAESFRKDLKTLDGLTAKNVSELRALADRYTLGEQQQTMMKELVKAFQNDRNYANFNTDPKQMTFLVRALEMHTLNLELHGRSDSLTRRLAGQEALLLAMGGGKSAGVRALTAAREIFKKVTGSEHAPAMMYVTATDALAQAIMKEPAFADHVKSGEVVEVNEETLQKIKDSGKLEADKIYVTSNEGLKKIDLELRSKGQSDRQIRNMYKDVASVAWDEFHSAFHTTDTILG
jgi:hypothetical protein